MASVVVNGFATANAMLGTNALAYLLATPANEWALDQLSKGAMQVAVQNGAEKKANLSLRMKELFFWMRLVICRWQCRQNYCASCRIKHLNGSSEKKHLPVTFVLLPQPINRFWRWFKIIRFVKICIIV